MCRLVFRCWAVGCWTSSVGHVLSDGALSCSGLLKQARGMYFGVASLVVLCAGVVVALLGRIEWVGVCGGIVLVGSCVGLSLACVLVAWVVHWLVSRVYAVGVSLWCRYGSVVVCAGVGLWG